MLIDRENKCDRDILTFSSCHWLHQHFSPRNSFINIDDRSIRIKIFLFLSLLHLKSLIGLKLYLIWSVFFLYLFYVLLVIFSADGNVSCTFDYAHLDKPSDIVTTAIGSVTFNWCDSISRRSYGSCTSSRIECVQLIFLRAFSYIGSTISSSYCYSGRYIWLDSGAAHIYVFGRSKCFRGANINVVIIGRDIGHQRFGWHK